MQAAITIKTGVLLVNTGTPEKPEKHAIRPFLKEFLSDPRVLDIPLVAKYLLLYLVILPFRPERIVHKYRKIWTKEGSPLIVHSNALALKLSKELGNNYVVEIGMRYGRPSIANAINQLLNKNLNRLIIVPLMPQYASATTGSIVEKSLKLLQKQAYFPELLIKNSFFNHPLFIESIANIGRPYWNKKPDHVLFSFHGLPKHQLTKIKNLRGVCLDNPNCCDQINTNNHNCYRAQCFSTAHLVAKQMRIPIHQYSIAFQSRLGKTKWIGPDTLKTIKELAQKGIKDLVVFCPSFVADCLETLEEIQIEGASQFMVNGGERFEMVPSLNSEDGWVNALVKFITE